MLGLIALARKLYQPIVCRPIFSRPCSTLARYGRTWCRSSLYNYCLTSSDLAHSPFAVTSHYQTEADDVSAFYEGQKSSLKEYSLF